MVYYRNPEKRWLFGVCAGLADAWQLNLTGVRLFWFFGALFFFPGVLFFYLLLAVLLKKKPTAPQFDTDFLNAPITPEQRRAELDQLTTQLDAVDQRLRQLEHYVTSDVFLYKSRLDDINS